MNQSIAYCGLDCEACPAFKATAANDGAALDRLAAEWSAAFGFAFDRDNIRCEGCRVVGGFQVGHCAECEMRACALGRGYATCAECADSPCPRNEGFLKDCPEAAANLDRLRAARAGSPS